MGRAEHGPTRGKRVGDGVPIESWAQCLSDHAQECIDCGIAPFPNWQLRPHLQCACCLYAERDEHGSAVEDDVHQGTGGHCQLHKAMLSAGVVG